MAKINWRTSQVLITGGTGSFGRKFVELMLKEYHPERLVIFSRDELKQHQMQKNGFDHRSLRYFIGDVRDVGRLRRALQGIDIVVHAAALKQVPACEYNPTEAVLTNIDGARNIIDASIDCGVQQVVAISTDKAVNPINLYGATKLVAEKLFIQGNAYSCLSNTRFSCVRYGNVVGSRGSVIPQFLQQKKNGVLNVTDPRMTRFWIDLEKGVRFVIQALEKMDRGEIFVPKIPSMSITELAKFIAPECKIRYTGIRPGEKIHEVLVSQDEGRNAYELDNSYVIQPCEPTWQVKRIAGARHVPVDFYYSSDSNKTKLDHKYLDSQIRSIHAEANIWNQLGNQRRPPMTV